MKNKLNMLRLLVIPAILLSSCASNNVVSEAREIDVLDLDSENLDKKQTIKARFIKGKDYVPYISLRQYASLYESHLADGMKSGVSRENKSLTWTIMNEEHQLYFLTQIDFARKRVTVGGSLEATFKEGDNPIDTTSLYYGIQTEYESATSGASMFSNYNFSTLNDNYFLYSGDYYLPLGFFDITYSSDSGLYYSYNYVNIYQTRDVENYATKKFRSGNKEVTVNTEMKANKSDSVMPKYLIDYNASLFFYLLDNLYGLKDYKQIKSAVEYCKEIKTYNALFSEIDSTRVQAYADTLAMLDDNHTALVSGNEAWGEQSFYMRRYGEGCINRSRLRGQLTKLRQDTTSPEYCESKEILYSDDQKTAMFLFDSFIFGSSADVFDPVTGEVKEDAGLYDSYFLVLNFLKTLKQNSKVENVVLDISTNGGGVIGVLMKLLPLISKHNYGDVHYMQGLTKQVGMSSSRVDSNEDGLYNTEDCYGDDFNIYLLTSDCSFSCGNAFPCYAQNAKDVKIIGQKSGGGECAVGIHYLPNGEYVYHSSDLHIGYYNRNDEVFKGYEGGAEPDIKIDNYADFYDINRLASYLN